MIRFVVVGTMKRGAVNPPEPLDETGQALAYWRWKQDEAMDIRVEQELAAQAGVRDGFRLSDDDCRVVWFEGIRKLDKERPALRNLRKEAAIMPTKEERKCARWRNAYRRRLAGKTRLRAANRALRGTGVA